MNVPNNPNPASLNEFISMSSVRASVFICWHRSEKLEDESCCEIDPTFDCSFECSDEDSDEALRCPATIDKSFAQENVNHTVETKLPLVIDSLQATPTISETYNLRSHRGDAKIIYKLISTFAHFSAILCAMLPINIGSIGQYGNSPERIFVKLIDPNVLTVQQDRRESIDSAASSPSIARRSKKDQSNGKQESLNRTPAKLTENDKSNIAGSEGSIDNSTSNAKNIKLVERDISPKKTDDRKDDTNFDSPSLQDSVASLPSVASAEQGSAAPQGRDADKFKKRILSAIYKAAYYPRAALNKKGYGEVYVSFIIAGDGSVEDVAIVRKSGSDILDKTALEIVLKASAHFPAIPETLGQTRINYVVPITFKKRS
ncbi:MAG: energy transducer TonB [Desulfomonilaceae bacterium]